MRRINIDAAAADITKCTERVRTHGVSSRNKWLLSISVPDRVYTSTAKKLLRTKLLRLCAQYAEYCQGQNVDMTQLTAQRTEQSPPIPQPMCAVVCRPGPTYHGRFSPTVQKATGSSRRIDGTTADPPTEERLRLFSVTVKCTKRNYFMPNVRRYLCIISSMT